MYRLASFIILLPLVFGSPIVQDLIDDLTDKNFQTSPDGGEWYVKRDGSGVSTTITFSNNKMWWGCAKDGLNIVTVDPVAEILHVGDICISSQCDESQTYSRDIAYIGGPNESQLTSLTLKAEGEFPTWMRNGLVQAMQIAAGAKGLITDHPNTPFPNPWICPPRGACEEMHCDVKEFSQFVGIKITNNDDGSPVARIAATFSIEDKGDEGFCETTDIAAAVSGAFGPWGAAVAGVVGTVKAAVCD